MSEITSRPYQPKMACERCCFGRGEHAEWCEWGQRTGDVESSPEAHVEWLDRNANRYGQWEGYRR